MSATDWKRLSATIANQRADAATERLSDLLSELGAVSVSIQAADNDRSQAIYEPPLGETPLWQRSRITGLFDDDSDLALVIAAIGNADGTGQAIEWQIDTLADQVWERVWMEDFHPRRIGARLWICPSWQPPPDPDAVNVLMDPGLAFGSGTHPTTSLCLAWLEANIHGGERLVDFGCGSGILGIAALRLGATQVIAIDNDPQAITATLENAERNQVDGLIEGLPDAVDLPRTELLLANILAAPLIELSTMLCDRVLPGGHIVLSGILDSQADAVAARYADAFSLDPIVHDQEWVRITGTRKLPKNG